MELLKQAQYTPYPVEDQVASIWAGTKGKLDDVPVEDVRRFESELLDHLRRNTDVLSVIAETGKLGDDTEAQLAVRLRAVEGDLEQHPVVEDAVLTLSLPDRPSLTP